MKKEVTIERFTKNDIELFWNFYREPKYAEFFRRCPKIWTKDELLDFEKTTTSTLFKIILDEQIIGFIILNDVCWYGLSSKIGIGLFEKYHDLRIADGKVCFLAMREIGSLCFDQMPLRKISVKFLKKREDIEQSLIKAGFKKEGEFKENVIYDGNFEDELEYALMKPDYNKLYKGE